MSLRHALLGLLAHGPASAAALADAFATHLARHGLSANVVAISPELASLEHRGLVEIVGTGARARRIFGVTADGREEVRRWLLEAPRAGRVHDDSVLRLFLVSLLDPADARSVLDGVAAACTADIDRLRPAMDVVDGGLAPGELPFHRLAGEYAVRRCEAVLGWAQWARDRLPPS